MILRQVLHPLALEVLGGFSERSRREPCSNNSHGRRVDVMKICSFKLLNAFDMS